MNHKTFLISVILILLILNISHAEDYITKGPAPGEIYFTAPHPSSVYHLALYHSWDYGITFTVIDSTSLIVRITADTDSGGIYYAADVGGLYYSSNYGYNFSYQSGGESHSITSGCIAGEIYKLKSGIRRSVNYGLNFTLMGNSPGGQISIGSYPGEIYAIYESQGKLFFSADSGSNFILINDSLPTSFLPNMINIRRGSITGELFLFNSETQELFFSNDSGKTFTLQYQFNYQSGIGYAWYFYITGSQQAGEVFLFCIKLSIYPSQEEFYIYHSTDYGQTWNLTGINKKETQHINKYFLSQNYPNPFNGETIIKFYLPTKTKANVTIYNIIGERVVTLLNEKLISGDHKVKWDGTNEQGQTVASGLYLYQLRTDNNLQSKKLLYLR